MVAATSEAKPKVCRRCGAPLAGAELSGNCPRCLATLLLSPDTPEPGETSPPPILRRLGDYELLEEVARGGMGVVFRARQVSLNRMVAVKVLRDAWLATPVQVKRFQAEAANAAKLKHPNIVAVHEVGEQGGQHYFAMDLIKGTNLAELTRERPLPPRRAAELVRKVAEAVQHAHQQGVLHRDVKPSNVLLDTQGEPQVTDFGLARALDDESSLTQTGQVLGTPGYIAPEQAKGGGAVGPAADVYGLGALLFHLLTGRPPFVGASAAETLTQVLQQEPLSPRLLNPAVPMDLAAGCGKCLGKLPRERYGSAGELAADLERYLQNETTHARPAGPVERGARWCRRKPALAAAVAALLVVGLVGLAGILWEWRRAEQHAKEENRQRKLAEQNERTTRQNLYAADMNVVQQALAQQNVGRARELLQAYEPKTGQPDLRGWEWWFYSQQCRGDDVFKVAREGNKVTALVSCARMNAVVAGWADGTIELWNLGAQKAIARLTKEDGWIESLESDPGGRLLAASIAGLRLRLWDITDIQSPKLLRIFEVKNAVAALAPHESLIAISTVRGSPATPETDTGLVGVWDYKTGEQLCSLPESGDRACFSTDGRTLVTGSWKGTVKVWNRADWSLRKTLHSAGRVLSLALSPNGRLLATSDWDGSPLLWDVETGQRRGVFQGHSGRVYRVRFSPEGRWLATASGDGTLGLWNVDSQAQLARLKGHEKQAEDLAFSPDGRWLASALSPDNTMRFWKVEASIRKNSVLKVFSLPVFSPDGKTVAGCDEHNQAAIWGLATGEVTTTLDGEQNPAGFTADGKVLITASVPAPLPLYPNPIAGLKYWDVGSTTLKRSVIFSPANQPASAVSLSPDEKTLATGDLAGEVILWDTQSGTVRDRLPSTAPRVWNLVFSPDSKVLAIGPEGNTKLWHLGSKRVIVLAEGAALPVAFSPDGQIVATGSFNEVKLWQTATGESAGTLKGHREGIFSVAFSKDGRTLASASEDIKLWNLATRREVASFRQDKAFNFVMFSPDGRSLLGGRVGEGYIWTAARPEDPFR